MTGAIPLRLCSVVTPRAGVWIEIQIASLKRTVQSVTPRAGVWIEIADKSAMISSSRVTPRAGVWIEICGKQPYGLSSWSLPVRECGLKLAW